MKKIVKRISFASLGMIALLGIIGCSDGSSSIISEIVEGNDSTTEIVDLNGSITEVVDNYMPAGWYMKTSVSAVDLETSIEYVHKTAGIFGELNTSIDGKDRHDIPGYGSAILQVVFVQTTWGKYNGDYFSDYRANSSDDEKKVWTFQVKNEKDVHLENSKLNIMLDGVYDVSYLEEDGRIYYKEELSSDSSKKDTLKLVDVDNQKLYTYADLQNAQLSMDGLNIRTFRWVIGDVDTEDYAPLDSLLTKSASIGKTASTNTAGGFVFEEKPSVEEVFSGTQR